MNVPLTAKELVLITRSIRSVINEMPMKENSVDHPMAALYWKLLDIYFARHKQPTT